MNSESQFDSNEWIGRLGASLESIATSAQYSLQINDRDLSNLTRDELKHALHSTSNPSTPNGVSLSGRLISDLKEQRTVLRDHPVLRSALSGTADDDGLNFLIPGTSFWQPIGDFASHLLRVSAISTGQEAARLLHRYLTDGESRRLQAREFIVLYGLKIAERIDLADGIFLAPLDDQFISQQGFTEKEGKKLKSLAVAQRDFQNEAGGSSVLVRDLMWGPGVAPGSDPHALDRIEVAYRFPHDAETVINLLSVASHCPLATSTRHTQLAKRMRNTHPNFKFGLWGSVTHRLDGWWPERDLSGDAESRFNQLLAGWSAFHFDSDLERNSLTLAIWRLSGSFARIGGWEAQDRILDYAIALEILYRLDNSELTYKLGTRAAFLLGRTPEERRQTFKKVTMFYSIRSAIVHGPTTKKQRKLGPDDFEQACADGRDLACDTLSELLRRGRLPNWNDLVLDGPTQQAPTS